MKKKIIIVLLLSTMLSGMLMTGCIKKEKPIVDEQTPEVIENMEQTTPSSADVENTNIGGWNVVNLPFEQASEEVKSVFKSAMETDAVKATNEMFAPVTYIGSQVVSGTNYGFITKDVNGADRYIYIYQNANNEIEKVEISKPNEKLEILPNISNTTSQNENSGTSIDEQNIQSQDSENSNSEDNDSTSTTSNTNNSNSNTTDATNNTNVTNNANNDSNNNTSQQQAAPKNIEEAIKQKFTSVEDYIKQYNPGDTMKCELKENTLTYSYTYPEEILKEHVEVYKEEIANAIKENIGLYSNTAKKLEDDSGLSGATVQIIYLQKDGNELVSFKINNSGLVG